MVPETLFSMLSDPTRLRTLMLILAEGELCVCELTFALDESQPKMSRHLALLREAGLLTAKREGTWMYYRLNDELPGWVGPVVKRIAQQLGEMNRFQADRQKLDELSERPGGKRCA